MSEDSKKEITSLSEFVLTKIHALLDKNRDYLLRLSEQADRIIVWLAGFSIAGIALTISHLKELYLLDQTLPKVIIIYSSLTIILGILYRAFMYLAQLLESNLMMTFEGTIEGYKGDSVEIHYEREFTGEETIENLLTYLEDDYSLKRPENLVLSGRSKSALLELKTMLLATYNSLSEKSKERQDKEIQEIKSTLQSHFGYSDSQIEKLFNPEPNRIQQKTYWAYSIIARLLFVLCLLSFMIGFIMIMVKMLSITENYS